MDADRFDTLARSLTLAGSRRRALATLSGVLGVALGASPLREGAEAKKKCPPCRKRKKGKCKKKKPDGTACAGGMCQGGRCLAPTCFDRTKNGTETGVDCGGPTCAPCAAGQGCTAPNDCASFLCTGGTCTACGAAGTPCGTDGDGTCYCQSPVAGGESVCGTRSATAGPFMECRFCPDNTICTFSGPDGLYCFPRCGES